MHSAPQKRHPVKKALINLFHKYVPGRRVLMYVISFNPHGNCTIGPYVKERYSRGVILKEIPIQRGQRTSVKIHWRWTLECSQRGMWSVICQSHTGSPGECISRVRATSKHLPIQRTPTASTSRLPRKTSCPLPLLLTSLSLYPSVERMGKRSSRRGNKELNSSPLLLWTSQPETIASWTRRVTWTLIKLGLVILITEIRLLLLLEVTRVYFFNLRVSGKAKGIHLRFHPDAGKELAQEWDWQGVEEHCLYLTEFHFSTYHCLEYKINSPIRQMKLENENGGKRAWPSAKLKRKSNSENTCCWI